MYVLNHKNLKYHEDKNTINIYKNSFFISFQFEKWQNDRIKRRPNRQGSPSFPFNNGKNWPQVYCDAGESDNLFCVLGLRQIEVIGQTMYEILFFISDGMKQVKRTRVTNVKNLGKKEVLNLRKTLMVENFVWLLLLLLTYRGSLLLVNCNGFVDS